MNESLLIELTVFVLAAFVGIEVISKVPTTLHTPLMSGTNAIHGVVIVGAILVAGVRLRHRDDGARHDRRRVRGIERRRRLPRDGQDAAHVRAAGREKAPRMSKADAIGAAYLIAASLFIIGLKRLSSPRTARSGNQVAAIGMAIAIVATLFDDRVVTYWWIILGALIGGVGGAIGAQRVKMTAMPQMVALFNGLGGGAAALVALSDYHETVGLAGHVETKIIISILFSAVVGSVSFSGR